MHSVVILTCWYGPYPWYFPYFIHSCSYNPSIDFYIITDNEQLILNKPSNVGIIFKLLSEIETTATDKFGFGVSISNPYKLCDFKPAYGFLFPELIEGYDFWGHGDLDIVYGDIRGFMTEEILNSYDIINSRHDYISGAFCLFRNKPEINTLFMQSRDYKKVYSSPEHFCFDECSFLRDQLALGSSILDFPDHTESMTYVVRKTEADEELKAYFDFIAVEGTPGKIIWDKGKIFYKQKYEAMFYHLVRFKNECKRRKVLDPIPDIYCFTPTNIIRKANTGKDRHRRQ